MGRYVRKKTHGIKDINLLLKAIKEIKINKKSLRGVSNEYKISRSSLHRSVTRLDIQNIDYSKIDDKELLIKIEEIPSYGAPTV